MSDWLLKYAHVKAVIASFALFFLRGLWMMHAPEKLAVPWVRLLPHVIDTILLGSAIALGASGSLRGSRRWLFFGYIVAVARARNPLPWMP